jgi:hypothetical protein
VSPGGSTERIEVFVGEVDASQAKGIHGLAEEGEDIRVHVVSREQAYAWLKGAHRQCRLRHRPAVAGPESRRAAGTLAGGALR